MENIEENVEILCGECGEKNCIRHNKLQKKEVSGGTSSNSNINATKQALEEKKMKLNPQKKKHTKLKKIKKKEVVWPNIYDFVDIDWQTLTWKTIEGGTEPKHDYPLALHLLWIPS